jgi:hypothetical protein
MSESNDPLLTVLLRHELPDGSWHVDWLIATDATSRLITFRLPRRVDEITGGEQIRAERLADHRRLYLDHEGPLPGPSQRGTVRRLAHGQVLSWDRRAGEPWRMRVQWMRDDGSRHRQTLRLAPRWGIVWVIVAVE